jgi:hypothetical protein
MRTVATFALAGLMSLAATAARAGERAYSFELAASSATPESAQRRTLARLEALSVVQASKYGVADPARAHVYGGAARSGEALRPQLLEYRFIAFRTINGIPFPHNRLSAGIRRDGQVSEISLGGPELRTTGAPGRERPAGRGEALAHRLGAPQVRERFLQAHPDETISQLELMYAVTFADGTIIPGTVVAPKYVVFSTKALKNAGSTLVSKKRAYT